MFWHTMINSTSAWNQKEKHVGFPPQRNTNESWLEVAPEHQNKTVQFRTLSLQWLPLLCLIIQESCWGQMKIWLFQGTFWAGRGAGVNERQMRVVPTQLFSQSRSKTCRTGRSTGNLRWVLPLFAVARRPAGGWKCLQWDTTSKPFPV